VVGSTELIPFHCSDFRYVTVVIGGLLRSQSVDSFVDVGLCVLRRGNMEQKLESSETQPVPHSPSLVTHMPYIPDVGTGMVQSVFRLRYGLDDRIPDK
jgi:hypothetical protein